MSPNILPCWMVKAAELHPASLLSADPHRRRRQGVVLPSHHQGGEHRRTAGPPPASLRSLRTAGRFLVAESSDVAMQHRLDAMRRLHFLFVNRHVGEGGLEELVVQSAVGHGTVEAADGPDADREGFGLQRPPDVVVALGQQRRRGRRAETLRLRLVEPSSLLWPRPRSVLHDSGQS